MKPTKSQKAYLNYFNKWEGLSSLGLALIFLSVFFLAMRIAAFLSILSMIGLPGGLLLYLFGTVGRANENDMRAEIQHHAESMHFKEFEDVAQRSLRLRLPKEETIYAFDGFELRDGLMLKKMKNGSLCSSEYTCARVYMMTDAFYIKKHTFSFVSDEKSDTVHEIAFDRVEALTIERDSFSLSYQKNTYTAKTCFLVITHDGGNRFLLHIKDDIYAEELVEKLKKKYLH